jgi:putative transposase
MPNYRRAYASGGLVFLTLVAHERRGILGDPDRIKAFRKAFRRVKKERPFEVVGAVVLPDHAHFLWAFPAGDVDYSRRVGRIKVEFTRSIRSQGASGDRSPSRMKHRESDVWQRRFWEYIIRDERDLEFHLDYIHYNPIKHGHATCPHAWPYSSFSQWVRRGQYDVEWGADATAVRRSCRRLRSTPRTGIRSGNGGEEKASRSGRSTLIQYPSNGGRCPPYGLDGKGLT